MVATTTTRGSYIDIDTVDTRRVHGFTDTRGRRETREGGERREREITEMETERPRGRATRYVVR